MINLDEIILQIRKGNQEAFELLFLMLEKSIKKLENKAIYAYKIKGIERDDIHNLLLNETFKVALKYEMDTGSFFSYWYTIQEHYLIKMYHSYKSKASLNYSETPFEENFLENYPDYVSQELEYSLHEDYSNQLSLVKSNFGDDAHLLLKLWTEGYSIIELERMFNLSYGQINYLLKKSINFLKKIYIIK